MTPLRSTCCPRQAEPGFPAVRVPLEVVSLVVLPPLLYAASEELP